ncbi:MAG: hypothetical protein NTU83_03715, partial [Candidatus Hydrogenedentes bacterium]|nr:hypothetical protein [Candidatus Hydrogenedentota bacterium]
MRLLRNVPVVGFVALAACHAVAGESVAPFWAHADAQAFAGERGISVDGGLPASDGFALDFEVLFDDVAREHQIFRQEGLLLLRMDPPGEGGDLSFFVNINGTLEPRLRSVRIEAGTWYRVTASWDGGAMWLRVGYRAFRAERRGGAQAWGKPLEIASTRNGAAGLRGQLRNVRVYNHPLTEVESLMFDATAESTATGQRPESPVFDFNGQDQGWRGVHTTARVEDGSLCADVSASDAFLLADGLDYEIDERPAVSLRFTAEGGEWATCYAATSAGKREAVFPIRTDGKMHNYVLWMDQYPEWRGRLKTLALRFDSQTKRVKVDFVRCGADVQTPPEFEVRSIYAVPPLPRAGREFPIRAEMHNVGGA